MRIISLSIVATLLLAPVLLNAQEKKDDNNLVLNGGFEEYEGKLKRLGSIDMASGWKSPTTNKADLFSADIVGAPISAPRNVYGDQMALTGNNYAGLRWWSFQNKQPRSYLQTKLKSTLKKDQRYCVKFYVSLGDLSKYATNEIGVYMSQMVINKNDDNNLSYNAQVPHLRSQIYDDMHSWQGVCGVYQAKGNEQYMIIGNFVATEKTDNIKVRAPKGETRPQIMHAYYYIDDVSVTPVKFDHECTCEQLDKAESEFIFSRRGAIVPSWSPTQKAESHVFYFKRFQRTIDRSMDQWVTSMVDLLEAEPTLKVQLTGHIDEVEKERMRMRPDLEQLGMERAEAVKEALMESGVAGSRITILSKDDRTPADNTGTEVGMSKNRRVEVQVVK
jgi:OOP family OmpA-OmpF porin